MSCSPPFLTLCLYWVFLLLVPFGFSCSLVVFLISLPPFDDNSVAPCSVSSPWACWFGFLPTLYHLSQLYLVCECSWKEPVAVPSVHSDLVLELAFCSLIPGTPFSFCLHCTWALLLYSNLLVLVLLSSISLMVICIWR